MTKTLACLAAVLAFVPLAFGSAPPGPGSLDPTFGRGGKVTTAAEPGFGITALARQPNGKVVAEGGALARYNPDGSLDRGFGADGIASTPNFGAYDLALQPDGKLVAGGASLAKVALARYNPDGSLDASFGAGGIAVTSDHFTVSSPCPAAALQRDRKIVIAASVNGDFALLRFQADGVLDPSFGTNGMVTTDFGGVEYPRTVVVEADGTILVAGRRCHGDITQEGGPCEEGDVPDSVLARYNPDGSLDASFGSGGKVISAFPEGIADVAVQTDGKIVATAFSTAGSGSLVRYKQDGSLDPSFGEGGKVRTWAGGAAAVAVRRSGDILVAGQVHDSAFALARYHSNGSLDPSFGSEGEVETSFSSGVDKANAILLEHHGKIVVAGLDMSRDGSTYRFALARYLGRRYCVVPKVKGRELPAARRLIRHAHCSVGSVRRAFSSKVKKGLVISQEPKPRTWRPFRAKVRLVVSKGKRR
jgi:uncharacterized delta-60 repeat protein